MAVPETTTRRVHSTFKLVFSDPPLWPWLAHILSPKHCVYLFLNFRDDTDYKSHFLPSQKQTILSVMMTKVCVCETLLKHAAHPGTEGAATKKKHDMKQLFHFHVLQVEKTVKLFQEKL